MASKNNTVKYVAGIAVLLLIVYLLNSAHLINLPFSLGPGWTTLSLSPVTIASNDPDLNGKAWLMTVSANTGGEHAYGSWDQTSTEFSGVVDKPDQFTITYDQIENGMYASYPISGSEDVNYINIIETDQLPTFDVKGWCDGQGGFFYGLYTNSLKYFCLINSRYGQAANLMSGTFNWKGKISVSSLTDTVSQDISNLDSAIVINNAGSPVVWVKWAGNLGSGQELPTTQYVKPIYNFRAQGWYIIDRGVYDSWKSTSTSFSTCLQSAVRGNPQYGIYFYDPALIAQCKSNLNGRVATLITTTTNNDNYFKYVSITDNGVSNSVAKVPVGSLQFPVLQFKIKAAFVGIYAPCGTPQVSSGTPTLTGEATIPQSGQITVKNLGTVTTSFAVSVSCPSGISANLIDNIFIDGQQSKTVPVTFTGAQAVAGNCVVTVKSLNCPNYVTTYNIYVTFTQHCAIQCFSGTILDTSTCSCTCILSAPGTCQKIVSNNPTECHYEAISGCGNVCPIPCNSPWKQNSICTGCECGLDASKAPVGKFLNLTTCEFQTQIIEGGGGGG